MFTNVALKATRTTTKVYQKDVEKSDKMRKKISEYNKDFRRDDVVVPTESFIVFRDFFPYFLFFFYIFVVFVFRRKCPPKNLGLLTVIGQLEKAHL